MSEALGQIDCKAPAKINILLKVLGKRPDGFHEIYSIMQAVNLFDDLSFTRIGEQVVLIECDDSDVPTGDCNTVARAFRLMKKTYSFEGGLRVRLKKRIPPGSGLGGGSSDCATTIRAICVLFEISLTGSEMARIGAAIGSDVPFFFSSGSALVRGRGEIVDNIDLPLDYSALIVVPNASVSTGDVYHGLKLGLTNEYLGNNFFVSTDIRTLADLSGLEYNDLEVAAEQCCPEIRRARQRLVACGFTRVSMSGSGSAVFTLIPFPGAESYERIKGFEWGDSRIFIVQPIRLAGV